MSKYYYLQMENANRAHHMIPEDLAKNIELLAIGLTMNSKFKQVFNEIKTPKLGSLFLNMTPYCEIEYEFIERLPILVCEDG